MKQLLLPSNVAFNVGAKTLTFSNTIPANIGSILHVTNVTRGVLYFQPQAGLNFSGSYTSPVLTLNCSTIGHNAGDSLEIFYDNGVSAATDIGITGVSGKTLTDVVNALGAGENVSVSNFPATQPVSAVSLPLPTGAATSALQTTGNASLATIATNTPTLISGRQPVDGSGVTQPVSIVTMPTTPVTGTFWQTTQPVSATTLPLPTGAATSALQTTGNTALATINTTLGSPMQAGGNVVATQPSVTAVFVSVAASTSGSIPIGAKGWAFAVLSGSGTFGGVSISAGFSDTDDKTLLNAINYTTNTGSTAYVRYNT